MNTVLRVKDLSISFGEFTAVNKISFEIKKGITTAIVGESGSGKSLTGLACLSLLPGNATVSGEVIFTDNNNSVNILSLAQQELTHIRGGKVSMVFQEPMTSLNPLMRCGEQITECLKLHNNISGTPAKEIALEWLRKTELHDPEAIYNKYPHQLSGGQKQRVMIAIAMCCEPLLIIADEPTTALDVTVQKSILRLLQRLSEENGTTILLITHDLGLVWDHAAEIMVMNKGEIVENGLVREVLSSPKHSYTLKLLQSRPATLNSENRYPVSNTEPDALEIRNMDVIYRQGKGKHLRIFKAVDNVNISVRKGELVGLVGESGCGKSSLGKAALGLIPSNGAIILNGKELKTMNNEERKSLSKELQIVFQDPYGSLNPRIPVDAAIEEVIKIHFPKERKLARAKKLESLFESVSLDRSLSNRYPHEFSGGQRQRICIARSLAADPSFLVFDESVSALDVTIQAQILELINKLRKDLNFSGIFISHDLSVVHYLCDRILVMQNGKIVEEGPASRIYHKPEHPYTRELIDAIPGKDMPVFN